MSTDLANLVSLLTSESKQVRRNALVSILKEVEELSTPTFEFEELEGRVEMKVDSDDEDNEDGDKVEGNNLNGESNIGNLEDGGKVDKLETIPTVIIKPVILRLEDPVEKCRELSYSILTCLFNKIDKQMIVQVLPVLVPMLVQRLGQLELVESSEEVRLLGVALMATILDRVKKGLSPFVDDWIQILSITLTDSFHDVRSLSCNVISATAKTLPEVFHYNSERLNKPLCMSLSHQQSKVRVSAVKCLGDVLLFGSHKAVEELVPHLITRVFDPQPNVRKAMVQVVGAWMMDFVDRYSYFHKFLPLMISGLCDECDAVRETADELWKKVGDKYLEENIQEYKDKIDFPDPAPSNYPSDVQRPNSGCRFLVQRNVGKLIPGIKNDIGDWVDSTRQKCSQLLYHLILHCEENITMHVEQVCQCIFNACLDTNAAVSHYALKSAQLLASFVSFPILWEIVSSRLTTDANEKALAVTASVLQGVCPSPILDLHIDKVTELLCSPAVCRTHKLSRQRWLLQSCNVLTIAVARVEAEKRNIPAANLFESLLTILGMSHDGDLKGKAIDGLDDLRVVCGFKDRDELFIAYCGKSLQSILESSDYWTPSTPEYLIFVTILTYSGALTVERYVEWILSILTRQLDPKREPSVALNLFTLISDILRSSTQRSDHLQSMQNFVTVIIEDVLCPTLVWKAGKSASALRAAALSCLLVILEQGGLKSQEDVASRIVMTSVGLLEDTNDTNRLLAVQCCGQAVGYCEPRRDIILHCVYPELVKRLDDANDDVRVSAGIAIARVFSRLSEDSESASFNPIIEEVCRSLLPHLDDEDENVQAAVIEALKAAGNISPTFMSETLDKMKGRLRTLENCEALIHHLTSLQIT